jgi:HK97 family phage portal protein
MMGFEGEAFALIIRDERYAVSALHLLPKNSCSPYVEQSTGEVFYSIGSNPMLPAGIQYMVPARDMIHFRQYTPRHPLIGESPIKAAAMALGTNVALSGNQAAFFSRMNRPSGVLSTDQLLKRDQIRELRAAFDDQAKGMNAGGIPILAGGLTFQPLSISSQDSQLIEAQKMSIEDVARVFGMPLALVSSGDAASGSTEALINFWLATGLGALVENIECSLERAFNLPIGDRIDFKVDSLLRIDFKTRMEGLSKGVQGGIYSPDEAREREQLPKVEGGDQVFLQRQMTPISLINDIAASELKTSTEPAVTESEITPVDEDDTEDEEIDAEVTQALTYALIRSKRHA